jgi:hypothetical protein
VTTNAPSNLVVTNVVGQCKQLRLTWNDNSSFTTESWRVERSPTGVGGPFTLIATFVGSTASTKSYLDTTVNDDTTYWYRVQWTNTATSGGPPAPGQVSAYSNVGSGNSGMVCTPTGFGVTVSLTQCDRLNLNWTDNSKVDTEYRIERTAAGGTCSSSFTQVGTKPGNGTTTGAMSHVDTGLTGGMQYCYRVRAYNSATGRLSAYSTCACQTVTSCTATK